MSALPDGWLAALLFLAWAGFQWWKQETQR
jgi:hypothetical protein